MRLTTRLIPCALLVCAGIAILMPIAHARQDSDADTKCLTNLKTIGLSMLMYVQDYDMIMPPTKNQAHLQKILDPYLKDPQIFSCPATSVEYKSNPYLGMIPINEIPSRATVPFCFDAKPHANGLYNVVYLDGHVKPESKAPVVKPIPRKKHSGAHQHRNS